MSSGPIPGQPQDPWQGGQPPADDRHPYGSWGGTPSSGAPIGEPHTAWPHPGTGSHPGATPYRGAAPAYPTPTPFDAVPSYAAPTNGAPAETWGPPAERRRGGNGLAIVVMIALTVLVCGGGPLTYYLVSRDSGSTSQAQHGTAATPTAGPTAAATTAAPTSEPTPTGGSGSDVFNVRIGDCLANEGTDTAPRMRKADCDSDTYEVLKRIPGTVSKERCNGVPGYTHNYFYDSAADDKDFVLCLRRR
jgi:hypothetical protein